MKWVYFDKTIDLSYIKYVSCFKTGTLFLTNHHNIIIVGDIDTFGGVSDFNRVDDKLIAYSNDIIEIVKNETIIVDNELKNKRKAELTEVENKIYESILNDKLIYTYVDKLLFEFKLNKTDIKNILKSLSDKGYIHVKDINNKRRYTVTILK